jgi:hypothetical protein
MCLATMALTAASPPLGHAQGHPTPSVASLKGISTVYVMVEELPDGARMLGLSKDAIQTDVELKLRLAGMRVVTEDEGDKISGGAFVYINVNLTDNASAAGIDVEFDQDALLARNYEFSPSVTTWFSGFVLANPSAQEIRDRVKDLVDGFLNAWLSVNPKK